MLLLPAAAAPAAAVGAAFLWCEQTCRLSSATMPPPPACLAAGWTFEGADDPQHFRRAMSDAIYTWREHRESFRWAGGPAGGAASGAQ